MDYEEFLGSKAQYGVDEGFKAISIPDMLFDFQGDTVDRALRKGRSSIFFDCGLGKTPMELTWADNVVRHTNKRVLYITPLGVAKQTIRESEKFGIEAHISNDGQLVSGINVTNYEKLHRFDPNDFAGAVCDESSFIKAMNGKRRAQVTEFLRTI